MTEQDRILALVDVYGDAVYRMRHMCGKAFMDVYRLLSEIMDDHDMKAVYDIMEKRSK